MSFSWGCTAKDGTDLFKKYDIHYQGLGLAPNTAEDTPACHRLNDIRSAFQGTAFKENYEGAACAAIASCQQMLQENLAELKRHHCATCTCEGEKPNWDMQQIQRFISIPLDEVWRADGGW